MICTYHCLMNKDPAAVGAYTLVAHIAVERVTRQAMLELLSDSFATAWERLQSVSGPLRGASCTTTPPPPATFQLEAFKIQRETTPLPSSFSRSLSSQSLAH